jgi:hypothetical protein
MASRIRQLTDGFTVQRCRRVRHAPGPRRAGGPAGSHPGSAGPPRLTGQDVNADGIDVVIGLGQDRPVPAMWSSAVRRRAPAAGRAGLSPWLMRRLSSRPTALNDEMLR